MFFFGGEKPIRKRDLPAAIVRQEFIWMTAAVILPFLGLFTLYFFHQYTSYAGEFYAPVIIVLQILYSLYLIWSILTEGIIIDTAKLKKFKNNQHIYFSKVINRKQLNRYYTGFFLYFLLMIFIIFSSL